MKVRDLAFGTALIGGGLVPAGAGAQEPFYLPPGDLIPDTGVGVAEWTVFAPGMRYPLEHGPSYPNSQVYMNGGSMGPAGNQCDAVNYSYPWRDNYCEKRSWDMPLCPAGIGHQGQDIRAPTCEKDKYWIVASAAGTVTNIGTYSVYVTTPSGQRFDYLHGRVDTLNVALNENIPVAHNIIKLSNNMGDTPTSIHLHFNIKQDVGGVGFVYVSPYMSLVEAYEELMGLGNKPPAGVFDQAACDQLYGWAQDPDAPEASLAVDLYFGAPKGDPAAVPVQVTADIPRDDLCVTLGSCNHGFALDVPLSLRDGQPHPIYAYAHDSEDGEGAELDLSPSELTCPPPPIPPGVRRWVVSPESLAAWKLSPFWQMIRASDPDLEAIPQSRDLGEAPVLARSEADPAQVWLIDQGFRRKVVDEATAAAWGFDLALTETWPAADLQALPEGAPVRPEPIMVQGSGPAIYLLDDHLCDPEATQPDPLCPDEPATTGADSQTSGNGSGSGLSGGSPDSASSDADNDAPDASASDEAGGAPALPPGYGQDDGCSCDQRTGAGGLGVLLALGLRRRRHARAPRT